MSAVDDYLARLSDLLRVHGRSRHRLLCEVRDHLDDIAARIGPEAAVQRFGPPADLAMSFDVEVAARRGRFATGVSVAGVLGVGASTLALVNSMTPGVSAGLVWAIVFFAAAQGAAVAATLAAVQALAMRGAPASPAQIALLGRRNAVALVLAGTTMFAAAAAVPGRDAGLPLLAGPVLAALAGLLVARNHRLTRRLPAGRGRVDRSPLMDLGILLRAAVPVLGPVAVLALCTVVATGAAFGWALGEHSGVVGAVGTAGIEAALVLVGFATLGRRLGLARAGRYETVGPA